MSDRAPRRRVHATLRIAIAAVLTLVLALAVATAGQAQAVPPLIPGITKLFHGAPADAGQFFKTFGREATAFEAPRIPREFAAVTRAGFKSPSIPAGRTMTLADAFLYDYQRSSGNVDFLVGHNDGGRFIFPDGSSTDLRTLQNPSNMLVVLSCYSADHVDRQVAAGVHNEIDLLTAVVITQRVRTELDGYRLGGRSVSVADVQAMVDDAAKSSSSNKPIILLSVVTVGSAGGLVLVGTYGGQQ